jgi:3-methyladenine DNA glycosylase AlkC
VAKVPYLNLGILYDQHLRQPQHSLGFYKCFLTYATDEDPNRVKVDQRIRELAAKYPSAANRTIECGKPYSPDLETKSVNLKAEMEKVEKEYELFEGQAKSEESKEVVIEKMVEEDSPEKEKGTSEADRRYLIGDYEEATRIYMDQQVSKLTPLQVRRLAIGLSRLQKHAEAEMWITMALGQEETPELVRAALVSLKAIEKQDKVDELCQKFKDRAEYKEALEPCNGP